MKSCVLVLALTLGSSQAFLTPAPTHAVRMAGTAVHVAPTNGGVKGSDLVCGQYETVGLVYDGKDRSQGGLKRKPTPRKPLLPKVPPIPGDLVMMTGGVNASTKLAPRAAPKP